MENVSRERAILVIITISLVASVIAPYELLECNSSDDIEIGIGPRLSTKLLRNEVTTHQPISVNNNSELKKLIDTNSWPGSGTENDPYIIQNLDIDATGHHNAIFVGNTSYYFEISDCVLLGASSEPNTYLVLNPYATGSGLALYRVTNASLINNYCSNNTWGGIYVYRSEKISIRQNECTSNFIGFRMDYSNNNSIIDNNFSGNYDGMFLESSNFNSISSNQCNDNFMGDGIDLAICTNCSIENNVCNRNKLAGIELQGYGANNHIFNNSLEGNARGIWLSLSSNNYYENNSCYGNGYGFYLDDYSTSTYSNRIVNNLICNNKAYGIYIDYSCRYNDIYGNIIMNNNNASVSFSEGSFQAFDRGYMNNWNNSQMGNCWSDWTKPDDNSDGIIDAPYRIAGEAERKDHYPIAEVTFRTSLPSVIVYTNERSINVSGMAIDCYGISKIQWTNEENGDFGDVSSSASWTSNVRLEIGVNNITFKMTDNVGKKYDTFTTIMCDITMPEAVTSPSGENVAVNSIIVVEFSETMMATTSTIKVDGVAGNTTWEGSKATFTPDKLDYDREYNVTVSAYDLAGNAYSNIWAFKTTAKTENGFPSEMDWTAPMLIIILIFVVLVGILLHYRRRNI